VTGAVEVVSENEGGENESEKGRGRSDYLVEL
jgi:hypothetical protein